MTAAVGAVTAAVDAVTATVSAVEEPALQRIEVTYADERRDQR